jgi:hypothetical protein
MKFTLNVEQNGKINRFFNANHTSEEYIAKYESNLDYFNELAAAVALKIWNA